MSEQPSTTYRKLLVAAVSSVLLEAGADTAEKDVLGTLTEMIQCYLCEIGLLSKNYCELAGRIEPIIADVILGFVEMGIDVSGLEEYTKKIKHGILPPLQQQQPQKQLSMLQAGTKQSLPSHIPPHLPAFPDPHAYIRTPTHKQPVIDYEAIREKAAIQKKDMERALTKFLAKTSQTHNLFDIDEANIFPLIACKPTFPSYLSALQPQDQIFDPEELEYDHNKVAEEQPRKRIKSESKNSEVKQDHEEQGNEEVSIKTEENTSSNWDIDNPYLAATKLPSKNGE